jgi:DNA adenine methylase
MERCADNGTVPGHSSVFRPLLKWAGGKRQLLPRLRLHYPDHFSRYIEPFFGSGAVFFDLYGQGLLAGRDVWLRDANADLVGCYRTLRENPTAVTKALEALARRHAAEGEACYYDVRDGHFNPARAAGQAYTPELAAMLIYLNRTGFNGLFRLNQRGAFNVPMGRYVNPTICDPSHLQAVAKALRSRNIVLEHAPFESCLDSAGDGDFVYCDPPYAPLSETSRFASYTAEGFAAGDQRRLQQAVIGAARRGAQILLSNSSAPQILSLYRSPDARRAGLVVTIVPARRSINASAQGRGCVDEVLVMTRPLALAAVDKAPAARSSRVAAAAKTA